VLAAIGIVTKDMERSIAFYSLLGISFKGHGEGADHFEGESNGMRVMLDTFELAKKINPDYEMPIASKLSLCFDLKDPKRVDEMFDKIIKAGFLHTKEPWDAFWNQRYAVVMDPSGNQVDLFANLSN